MNADPRKTALHLAAHTFAGFDPGARLIVLGAVHGNETCGTKAIRRVITEIESGTLDLARGCVTFVPVTNPLAYLRATREGERNLNRHLRPVDAPDNFEDRIANRLCPLLAAHDVVLDLHSFHTPGEPFVMLGPENNTGTLEPFARADEERRFARHLGVTRFVDGWLDTYARGVARRAQTGRHGAFDTDVHYGIGTTEYMRSIGGYGVTLECGAHDDPHAPEVAYRAILNALSFLGLVRWTHDPRPATDLELLRLVDVIDKKHEADAFEREWASFAPLHAGQRIGVRNDGTPVEAPVDGFIVFPNPAARAGEEWFYLAVRSPMELDR